MLYDPHAKPIDSPAEPMPDNPGEYRALGAILLIAVVVTLMAAAFCLSGWITGPIKP